MTSSSDSQTKFGGHFWSLHGRASNRSSLFSWAQKPVPFASTKMSLRRTSIPPLHALVHSLHSPQSARTHGTLHASTLHICVSVVAPHSLPPKSGSTSMFRLRDITPPPQSLEQPDQPDQSSITQSIGHGCVWHSCSIWSGGQSAPQFASTSTSRVTICVPPAHETEQSCGTQSPTSQSAKKASCSASL